MIIPSLNRPWWTQVPDLWWFSRYRLPNWMRQRPWQWPLCLWWRIRLWWAARVFGRRLICPACLAMGCFCFSCWVCCWPWSHWCHIHCGSSSPPPCPPSHSARGPAEAGAGPGKWWSTIAFIAVAGFSQLQESKGLRRALRRARKISTCSMVKSPMSTGEAPTWWVNSQFYTGWWFQPSEKYESQLGWFFPIYGKIKRVPNHQPVHGCPGCPLIFFPRPGLNLVRIKRAIGRLPKPHAGVWRGNMIESHGNRSYWWSTQHI